MFRRINRVILFCVFCTSLTVQASSVDISLGQDAAQVKYLFDTAQLGIGGADRGFAVFYNEKDDILGSFQFLVTGNVVGTDRSLQLGAGLKAYVGLLDTDDEGVVPVDNVDPPVDLDPLDDATAGAIGIGGRLSYILPSKMPMGFFLELYLAPNITSFADINKLLEVNLGYEIEVAPSTRLYVGYRKLEVDVEDGIQGYELDDSGHVGIRVSF